MVKIDFGGVKEDVITRKEFTVEQAQKSLKVKSLSHLAMVSKAKRNHLTCETTE